jgi:hypothetical protein
LSPVRPSGILRAAFSWSLASALLVILLVLEESEQDENRAHSLQRQLPTSPTTPMAPPTVKQSNDQQKDHSAYEGVDDRGDKPETKMNAQSRQQPIPDKRSHETDYQIADQPEAAALHHAAG